MLLSKSKEKERLHLKFLKRLLNVNQTTCNSFVYGELGRYPLYVNIYVRITKYWLKVRLSENIGQSPGIAPRGTILFKH